MKYSNTITTVLAFSLCSISNAFAPLRTSGAVSQLKMGLFDDLSLIFSDEGKKNRAAYEAQQKAEQEEAQRLIMERRRNPEKMEQYEEETNARRNKLIEDSKLWDFQRDDGEVDPMETWNQLRSEGKIVAGDDIERDPTSSRLGSEGLQEIRTDDKLPYVEQGYVDESADVMGNIKKMFGKKD